MSQSVVTVCVGKSEFRTNKLANPSPPSDPTADTAQGSVSVSFVEGSLPGGKYLVYPIVVWIQRDDGEFLVSECHFYIHASGSTVQEAIAEFKRILSEELDLLTADEDELGPRQQAQLQYLRNAIRVV